MRVLNLTALATTLMAALFLLTSCDSSDNDVSFNGGNISITENGVSQSITHEGEFNLRVVGDNIKLVIKSGAVRRLSVSGDNNQVRFQPEVQVSNVTVTGNNNLVQLPQDTKSNIDVLGGNNNQVYAGKECAVCQTETGDMIIN